MVLDYKKADSVLKSFCDRWGKLLTHVSLHVLSWAGYLVGVGALGLGITMAAGDVRHYGLYTGDFGPLFITLGLGTVVGVLIEICMYQDRNKR